MMKSTPFSSAKCSIGLFPPWFWSHAIPGESRQAWSNRKTRNEVRKPGAHNPKAIGVPTLSGGNFMAAMQTQV
jgi:hypothetical protein